MKNQLEKQLPFKITVNTKRGRKKEKHDVVLLEARKFVRLTVEFQEGHRVILKWDKEDNLYKTEIIGVIITSDYDVEYDFDYQVEKIVTKPKKHDTIKARKSKSGLPKKYDK